MLHIVAKYSENLKRQEKKSLQDERPEFIKMFNLEFKTVLLTPVKSIHTYWGDRKVAVNASLAVRVTRVSRADNVFRCATLYARC